MATLSDFKRAIAKEGAEIRGGYFFRVLKDGITPEQALESLPYRKVGKIQSNGAYLLDEKGKGSFMDYPKANNSEFDGKILKIYAVGYRKLTDEEKAVLAEWEKITETPEYKKQMEYDLMTDCSCCYSKAELFFYNHNMEYLHNHGNKQKYLDYNKYGKDEYCVYDSNATHGKEIARYELK